MHNGIRIAIIFAFIAFNGITLNAQNVTVSDVADNVICQCGTADKMKNEISEMIGNGFDEEAIYARYIKQYGQTVMAAPPKEGFYNTLWFAPGIGMLFMGLVIVLALKKWSKKNKDNSAYEENEEDIAEEEIERDDEYYEKKLEEELRIFFD